MMPLLLRVRFFQVLLGAVLTLIVSLVFGAMPQEVVATAGVPCHTITSPTTVISSKYGSPINFFGAFPTPLLTVSCVSDGSMVFTAGDAGADTYIYKYAYHKVQGKWQKITFTGGKLEGVWYRGTAEAVLSNPTTGGDGSVLAYMCQKVAGAWKCGCADKVCASPKWQIQYYRAPKTTSNVPDLSDLLLGTQKSDELYVSRPSTYHALPGSKVTLYGNGFSTESSGNVVLWNDVPVATKVVSANGLTLTFSAPDLPPGKYKVNVKRGSKVTPDPTVVWIKDETLPNPTITSITPALGAQGDTFTVHGSGFMKEGNNLVTTFGILEGLPSSDGVTILFTYNPFKEPVDFRNEDGTQVEYEQKVNVIAVTAGGVSVENVTFGLSM